jgi:hypothetical protein
MEKGLQSLFGLLCTALLTTHWLRPRRNPPPRIWAHIIRIWDNIPDYISESLATIFLVKILKFFDADTDPGSGIFLTLDPG